MDIKKTDKRADVLEKLAPRFDELVEWTHTVAGDSRLLFGAELLGRIAEHENGRELLMQFAGWSVHPRSGFLPQTQSANPLSAELKDWFEGFAAYVNKTQEPWYREDAPELPPSYYPDYNVNVDDLTLSAAKALEMFVDRAQETKRGAYRS